MDPAKRKALVETLKSVGRGLWFGILGLVVVALTAVATSGNISDMGVTVAGFTLNLSVIIVAVVGFLAKTIDTYIHKNDNIASNGLAPGFLQSPTPAVAAPAQVVTPTAAPAAPETPAAPTQTQIPVTDAPSDPTPPSEPLNS